MKIIIGIIVIALLAIGAYWTGKAFTPKEFYEEADCYICYGLKIWALFWLIVVASWGVGSFVMQLL